MRIWKVALEGGKPIPVSLEDGFCCEESRDGSKILYTRSGPRRICQVDKESPLKETVLLEGIRWGRWTVATEGLYFLEINNSLGNRIKFYEFSSGKTSTVLDLPQAITHFPGNRSLFISADEKRLYFSGGHQDVDIVLVEGF